MRLPFVMRWQLDLSERRRVDAVDNAERQIANLRERLAESRETITELRRLYHGMVDGWIARDDKHIADLAAVQAQHHELAMHPPTGILTGTQVTSPLDIFGEKTRETLRVQMQGLSPTLRDAMLHKALRLFGQNVLDDHQLAAMILKGETVQ